MYHRSPGTSSLVSEMPLLPSSSLRWRRVLLKVSGEALLGDGSQNIDPKITMSIAREVAIITRLGVEVCSFVKPYGISGVCQKCSNCGITLGIL